MKKPLTKGQQRVMDMIVSWIDAKGFPPTRQEMADELGFSSPNAAQEHVKALVRKGYLRTSYWRSRGIEVVGRMTVTETMVDGLIEALDEISKLTTDEQSRQRAQTALADALARIAA